MATEHESSGLASSLTDLMTSLAVIFILLLVAMLNNARQQTQGTRNQILAQLEKALEIFQKEGVKVESDPKDPLGLLVIVPEDLLRFAQGKSDIPPAGGEFLKVFVPKLVGTACSNDLRDGISSIVVEGHASSEGDDQLNLQLSQNRSMSVVQASLEALAANDNGDSPENRKCFLDLVSATGRGSADPIMLNGEEDRPLSRRVVFKIRVKSLEQRGFETHLGIADVKPTGN